MQIAINIKKASPLKKSPTSLQFTRHKINLYLHTTCINANLECVLNKCHSHSCISLQAQFCILSQPQAVQSSHVPPAFKKLDILFHLKQQICNKTNTIREIDSLVKKVTLKTLINTSICEGTERTQTRAYLEEFAKSATFTPVRRH